MNKMTKLIKLTKLIKILKYAGTKVYRLDQKFKIKKSLVEKGIFGLNKIQPIFD